MSPLQPSLPSPHWMPRLHRALILCALAVVGSGIAGMPSIASGATNSTSTPATTPTFPIPASAKVQGSGTQAQTGTSTTPTAAAGGTGAPATGAATTPTTTYVPGAATAPAATTPSTATTTATPAPGGSATAVITRTPANSSTSKQGDRPLSTGAILLAVLAALLVLGCLLWALARRRAFEPEWLLSLRHAIAEAGFRASATWAEFTDWVRLGR